MTSLKERKPLICEFVRDLFYVVTVYAGQNENIHDTLMKAIFRVWRIGDGEMEDLN
jgi:hypothetical protein